MPLQEAIEQVEKAAEENRIVNQKADFLTNCVNPLIRLLTRIAHVVIAVIAGKAMLDGRMTVGVVQAFFQYVNQTAEPMTEASYMINSLQSALASAERTFELLDEEEEIPDKEGTSDISRAEGWIGFNQHFLRLHGTATTGHLTHWKATIRRWSAIWICRIRVWYLEEDVAARP